VPLSALEQEAIILNAVWDAIDGIANLGLFTEIKRRQDAELMFETRTDAVLSSILLGDFLSLPQSRGNNPLPFDLPAPGSNVRPSDLTYLFYVRQVGASPRLGPDPTEMIARVDQFSSWLYGRTELDLGYNATVTVQLSSFVPEWSRRQTNG
jgi:hypothetical protein